VGGKARPGARRRAIALVLAQTGQCRIHGDMPPV
jgi:hypothetical protein